MLVVMLMFMVMRVFVLVVVFVTVLMFMGMVMFMAVLVLMLMVVVEFMLVVPQMHIKLCPFDLHAFGARSVQVVTRHAELGQFPLQIIQLKAKIQHRTDKHIAAETAENIQIKRSHFQRALIWLAA